MLPTDPKARKEMPMARGLLDYFADALAEVANVSRVGNEQHNPGEPMHWAKEKSTDEADCIIRHLIDRGTIDSDGLRHSAKVAWRALALLQREIEAEVAEEPYAEGAEKCRGSTNGCMALRQGLDACGHECDLGKRQKPGSIRYVRPATEQPLDYFCVQHKRYHRGECQSCVTAASSR